MKMKQLAAMAMLSIAVCSNVAQANIKVNFSGPLLSARGDQCNQIQGTWTGNGTVQSVCKYHGKVNVTSLGSPGNYNLNVNIVHDDWYFFCPDPKPFNLPATCNGSTLDIKTNSGTHLSGETDGHTTNLSGPVVLENGSTVNIDSLKLTKE